MANTKTQAKIKAKNLNDDDRKYLEAHADKLSDSTLRAKWINAPDQHEDHPGETLATRNHEVIKQWVSERNAEPATVEGTEHGGRLGVLRFDFPGYDTTGNTRLEHVSWDDWFKTFDDRNLVFLYQEHKSDGSQSNFCHFDSPDREHD